MEKVSEPTVQAAWQKTLANLTTFSADDVNTESQ